MLFNFFLGLNFYFPLFWGMVMYDNEFKQRKMKFKPRKKLNHNVYTLLLQPASTFASTMKLEVKNS